MHAASKLYLSLFALIGIYVNGVQIDLVRTAGGHLGSHFFLGSESQYRFLLFDLTETNLWTFATTEPLDLPYQGSGPYDLSNDDNAVSNITNGTSSVLTSNKAYAPFGYYDAPIEEYLYKINISQIMINNVTVRNMSTQIFALPIADQAKYQAWNYFLFDGVFGIGHGLLNANYVNYTTGWMNKNSSITLFTPRDVATAGMLLLNDTGIPEACETSGITANLSKTVYLRYEDFEFNITQIQARVSDNDPLYYTKIWPSTISTMSSFIAVDDYTWQYLSNLINPVFDPYATNGNDIAAPFYKVHCSLADELNLTVELVNANGVASKFLIPGSSLVKPNPNGECLLKIKQNTVDAWILGTPFLENYCIKIEPRLSQITIFNTTDQVTYPPALDEGESQLFVNTFMSRG